MDCSSKNKYSCQLDPPKLHGRNNLTLEYTQSQLTFPYFQLWYRYKAVSLEVLDFLGGQEDDWLQTELEN